MCVVLGGLALEGKIFAQNQPGHVALGQAVQVILLGQSVYELSRGAELCRQALARLPEAEDRRFCRQLLASALIQRASYLLHAAQGAQALSATQRHFWAQVVRSALHDALEALELLPEAAEPYYLLGRLKLLQGRRVEAQKLLRQSLRYPAEDPRLRARAMALLAQLASEDQQRRQFYDHAVQLAPADPEVRLARARFLAQAQRWNQALADLQAALHTDPESVDAALLQAEVLLKLGRKQEAWAVLTKLRKQFPQHPQVHLLAGMVEAAQGNFDQAVLSFSRAIALGGAGAKVLALRAQALLRAGKVDQAQQDALAAVRLEPQQVSVLALALDVLVRVQEPQECEPLLAQQLKRHPHAAPLWHLEAIRRFRAGKFDLAVDAATRALSYHREFVPALLLRARLYWALGQVERSIRDYQRVLAHDPQNLEALNNLAWLLATAPQARLRNGVVALRLAQRACRLTHYRDPALLSTLAAAYAELGRFEEAQHWALQALRASAPEQQARVLQELHSYRAGRPWRLFLPRWVRTSDSVISPLQR